MWVATFHSACVRILRKEHEAAGLTSSFSIYDTADSVNLMKLVMRELDLDPKKFTPKSVLGRIGRFKDELISPEVALAAADTVSRHSVDHAAAIAYPEYQRRLEAANAVDFDDIIVKTVRLLQDNSGVFQGTGLLGGLYDTQVNGVRLVDWIKDLVDHKQAPHVGP